jgi:hypothetical protein
MSLVPLFISAATIKTYGIIEGNVDDKLITQTIVMVQDMQLQQLLGTDLYKEIASQIDAGTLTALNTTLLDDYITNFLMNAVIADGIITFNYRIANKAVITANSDNQQPIGSQDLELIRAKWQSQADFYAKRLTKYLVQESTAYPLYLLNQDISDIQARSAKYKSGFYLGTTRRGSQPYRQRVNYPYCLDDNNDCNC